jgi:CRP/FNR family transcriptional regulator, cyclic AMP receptor protein
MTPVDLAGWLAAGFTLLTFVCRDMRRLRLLAICANLSFIVYGAGADLMPVLALHLLLAPVNAWRLRELRHCPPRARPVARPHPRAAQPGESPAEPDAAA